MEDNKDTENILCDTKRLPPVIYFTRAIIHKQNTLFRGTKNRDITFSPKYASDWISRSESHFSLKLFIGLDSSIRDLVDFRGWKMGSIFSKIWKAN